MCTSTGLLIGYCPRWGSVCNQSDIAEGRLAAASSIYRHQLLADSRPEQLSGFLEYDEVLMKVFQSEAPALLNWWVTTQEWIESFQLM